MMDRGDRRGLPLLLAALLSFEAIPLAALDWPLDAPQPAATFGTAARGRILTGVDLASGPAPVRSSGQGELLFAREADDGGILPSTLGSYVAVAHSEGLVGLYAHMAPGSAGAWLTTVESGAPLGTTGQSGWIEGEGLQLSLFDLVARRWVNPLLILPPLPDSKPPAVRGAWLAGETGTWPLGETRALPQGRYLVVVDCGDPQPAPWSPAFPAPFFIRVLVDGVKAAELEYGVAFERDGALGLFSEDRRVLADLQAGGKGMRVATREFRRGKSLVEVLVRDQAGNERRASWTVDFR